MLRKQLHSTRGFSLIELLVVTTIIIVLSAIGLVTFQNAGQSARNGKRKADLESVRQALVLYRSDQGAYPNGDYDAVVAALVSNDYLSEPAPSEAKSGHAAYRRNDTNSTATFCICATMEGDDNPGNSTTLSCSFGTGGYYCVANP